MRRDMNRGGRPRGESGRDGFGAPRPSWLRSVRPGADDTLPDLPDGASLDDEPPVDLSLLVGLRLDREGGGGRATPGVRAARFDDLVARIERAAEPELARRARLTTGVLDFIPLLARSVRPALVAAAAALVLGVGLARVERAAETHDLQAAAGAAGAPGVVAAGDIVAGQLFSDASDERPFPASTSDDAWVAQQRAPSTAALAEAIGLGMEGNP